MGNRAIVRAKGNSNKGVYLHWNGGRDSVEAFLKYCELRGFAPFEDEYGMARFVQVVSNFFGADGLSIGITENVASTEDNGVYIVEGWEIVGRETNNTEQCNHDLHEMLLDIDRNQPIKQQLGADYLNAKNVKTAELRIGDTVYVRSHTGTFEKLVVVGFGADEYCNGMKVHNIPYVNKYMRDGSYANNLNNYIRDEFVRIVEK